MAKARKNSAIEEFIALPDEEKERIVAEFDKEFCFENTTPLTPAQRKLWNKAKRKLGRPKVGAGATSVLVSVERTLLRRADAYAKAHGMTRSGLIAEGLQHVIGRKRRAS